MSLKKENQALQMKVEKLQGQVDAMMKCDEGIKEIFGTKDTRLQKDLDFQKAVSRDLQMEMDIEHIRFLDEQQRRGDDLCRISQALGIEYHGDNADIFNAIKALKKENEKLKENEKGIMEEEDTGHILGCNSYEKFCQAICELNYNEKWITELKEENEKLKEENASMNVIKWANDFRDMKEENEKLKASDKQKSRIIKKLKQ